MTNDFQEDISNYVWTLKYRYQNENNINETWARMAKAVAAVETEEKRQAFEKKFYDVLDNFNFLPGGRIFAGIGTQHDVTLFNCFVMPIAEDSLHGIFDALKEGALTLQQGGGIGYDFSILRPKGFLVKHTGAVASGPVSFMRIWNAMCSTMLTTGSRRGAMMGVLRCDHPDIEEFIQVKNDPHELRHFNISVLISDAFMQAVKENKDWPLIFPKENEDAEIIHCKYGSNQTVIECEVVRRVNARTLWEKIIKAAYQYAEPGVLFENTINRQNNLWYREWISATNPCGEIPLPSYGACNLGSINLTQFINHPFTENANVDWHKLQNAVEIATRFLDNVIDISLYPLKMQKRESLQTRRMGLGLTGLADSFVMLGLRYGEQASLKLANQIMQEIAEATWNTSIELAKERGSFPRFKKEEYLKGEFVQSLNSDIQNNIQKFGMRNSHHNAIAPAGTISLLANNVSNGLEPIFSACYERKVRKPTGELTHFSVTDYAFALYRQKFGKKDLPPAWVDTQNLQPIDHLNIQAAIQPYVDQAISKTINIPETFPLENLLDVYQKAYELKLKGCTIYRPNKITGSVLSVSEAEGVDSCCVS